MPASHPTARSRGRQPHGGAGPILRHVPRLGGALLAVLLALAAACVPTETEVTPTPTDPAPKAVETPAPPPPAEPEPVDTPDVDPAVPGWLQEAGGHLYFLREGDLWRHDVLTGDETMLFQSVTEFAVSEDNEWHALIRGDGLDRTVWVAGADWPDADEIAAEIGFYGDLTWSANGTLAFSYSDKTRNGEPLRPGNWPAWCSEAEIQTWSEADGVQSIGPGCEPAWSPEGLRIAAVSQPELEELAPDTFLAAYNALDLMNAEGENRWSPVPLEVMPENLQREGEHLYRPVWLPDGDEVAYARMVGYAIACDHTSIELTDATEGGAELLWALPDWANDLRISPDGRYLAAGLAVCDAAGFMGYNALALSVLDITEPGEVESPVLGEDLEPVPTVATRVVDEPRTHSPVWAPAGSVLAVIMPPAEWDLEEEVSPDPGSPFSSEDPGRITARDLATGEQFDLVDGVDFGSPLFWVTADGMAQRS